MQSNIFDGDAEVELLVELWALGLVSATTLQAIGAAAVVAAPRPQMRALAQLGAEGVHRNNCHRDLQRKLGVNGITVAPRDADPA